MRNNYLGFLAVLVLTAVAGKAAVQIDLASVPADFTIWGGTAGDELGRAVTIGDYDGDGHLDVALSQAGNPTAPGKPTNVCLYFGPFSLPLQLDRATSSPPACIEAERSEVIGLSLATADFDDDGIADLIVGIPGVNTRGAVEIYRGRRGWPASLSQDSADWVFRGGDDEDHMEYATAGDINGDGLRDLILFAFHGDGLGNLRRNSGEAYIFFGPSSSWRSSYDLSVDVPDVVIYGADARADRNTTGGDELGIGNDGTVADVLGDTIPDLIIGCYSCFGPMNDTERIGEVYVLRGRSIWPSVIDLRNSASVDLLVYGPPLNPNPGSSALHRSTAADLDGDGRRDLILGAPWASNNTGRTGAGVLYIFRGGSGLSGIKNLAVSPADVTIVGAQSYSTIGYQLLTGDVNGDGFTDIITAGNLAQPLGRLDAGTISVIAGCAGFPPSHDLASRPAALTILGADPADWLGAVLAGGDFDGDGRFDVLSGGYQAFSLASSRPVAGEAHMVLGRPFDSVCSIVPEPGAPVDICGPPRDITLSGSATVITSCSVPHQFRWLEGTAVIRGWAADPTVVVRPSTTTNYRLEVRCGDCNGPCFASATVLVTVDPDTIPPGLGNSLYALRRGSDIELLWATILDARTYSLFRSTVSDSWPVAPYLEDIVSATVMLPDVSMPPNAAEYYYRAAGASCSGLEGP